jgi:hypothetical protein
MLLHIIGIIGKPIRTVRLAGFRKSKSYRNIRVETRIFFMRIIGEVKMLVNKKLTIPNR